mgnify:CR=1 FL=1
MVLGIRFRTRSPLRDQEGDHARIQSVREALLAAKASAERESEGLRRRITEWQDRAVAIIDTSGDYGSRDAEEENEIAQATQAAMAGEERLNAISRTLSIFDRMLDELSMAENPETEGHNSDLSA